METKSEVKTMQFNVVGENMTRLIRTLWCEGRVSVAFNVANDCGCPEKFWMKLCTGQAKMVGQSKDDTLGVENDDTKKHDGIDITLDAMVKRFEDAYVKKSILFINADNRMRYWPLIMGLEGV